MSCPRCGSNNLWDDNLWDDNLWWGCNACGYAANESGGTMFFAKDIPGLPRTVCEVNKRSGMTLLDYMPRLVKENDDGSSCA